MSNVYVYAYMHLDTGTVLYDKGRFLSEQHFFLLLDKWNRIGQGRWQYWRDLSGHAADASGSVDLANDHTWETP